MKSSGTQTFTAYVGIDWADAKHDFCLQERGSDQREFGCIAHDVECIDEWAKALHERFGGPIAIALELAKGPIVYALQKYDFLVLFPINPLTLAKYREAFTPSRAKDDPTDAELALDLLVRHPERFAPLQPQSVAMRTLISLTERRRELVNDKTRITNRLTYTLKQYYPQALQWIEQHDTVMFCDFLTRWPTLLQAKRAHQASLKSFFHAHNAHRHSSSPTRLKAIKAAVPLTQDPGVIVPCKLHVMVLVEQLRLALQAIEQFDRHIAELAPTLPDYRLFRLAWSWPAPGASAAGCLRGRSRALPGGRGVAEVHRDRPCDRAQRQKELGPLALAMSDLPASDLHRMGRPDDQ